MHKGTQSFRSIFVPVSGQTGCSHGYGTIAYQFCFAFRSDGKAIVPLTCSPFVCSGGNGTIAYCFTFRITYLGIPFSGTERFYLKHSSLNATLRRSTLWNNMERSGTKGD